jgi:hypothetical protein
MDSDQHSYDSYTHTCRGGDTGNGEHSGVSAMLAYGYTVSSSSVVGFRALVMTCMHHGLSVVLTL